MIPTDRDFNKDSKKYLFAILGFFYKLLWIFIVYCKNDKSKTKYYKWVPGFYTGVPRTFAIKAIRSFVGQRAGEGGLSRIPVRKDRRRRGAVGKR